MPVRTVEVRGREYEVKVDKLSPSSYRVAGTYMGEQKIASGRTENVALTQWRRWAEYHGNTAIKT